jgi:hypothetical protein
MGVTEAGVARAGASLTRYYDELRQLFRSRSPTSELFAPAFELPPLDDALGDYFSVAELRLTGIGAYRGRALWLLDLAANPRTRTTKTFASLTMVARAVEHTRRTGERVVLVTPTSGNKGTALRDAVLRAYETGVSAPDELGIVTLNPAASLGKLWHSPLADDRDLRRRNPVLTYAGDDAAHVKTLAREAVESAAADALRERCTRLWYTLDLDNYRLPDALRAFVEADVMPPADRPRVHAHAVSSAYGLLGYSLGWHWSNDGHEREPHPQLFLVQHLATPDLVLHLAFGSFSRANLPPYRLDDATGLYVQTSDLRFPAATFARDEAIDPTFYTREPPTAPLVGELVSAHGGGGIVVSLFECLSRYGEARRLAELGGRGLPSDPRLLREWALTMALVGVLEAADRDLLPEGCEVVVHASGTYSALDFEPLDPRLTIPVGTAGDVRRAIVDALPGPR